MRDDIPINDAELEERPGAVRRPGLFVSQAFGLRWRSDWPLPWFAPAPDDGRTIDVEVERAAELTPRPDGRRINHGVLYHDGTRFTFEGAVIDMFGGRRIRWFAPAADEVPLPVSSTVAAHLLAWRGLMPLHGSAVAIDREAVLVCGPSGAGKSTLADALIASGGRLVSDDLSVMLPVGAGERPMLLPGRPAVRLSERQGDGKDKPKRLALPNQVDPDRPVPLAMLLMLQDGTIGASPEARAEAMLAQMFRPAWMRVLPGAKERAASLLNASQRIAVASLPPAPRARDVSPAVRAGEVLALLRRSPAAGLSTAAPAA